MKPEPLDYASPPPPEEPRPVSFGSLRFRALIFLSIPILIVLILYFLGVFGPSLNC